MHEPMTLEQLRGVLATEKAAALGADTASELSRQRAQALDYYLGEMDDLPSAPDRSKAVSTDVSDTVEGLMPSLMEVFASGDEVVRFEPVGPEDEAAAEQETDYVNHVFLRDNDGWDLLYTGIKDALLSKVGIWKVWWEAGETREEETFEGQPPEVLGAMVAEGWELAARTERADGLVDFTVRRSSPYGRAKVACVPPEEFGISRRARRIKDAAYAFHRTTRSVSDLIEAGYDRDQVMELPASGGTGTAEGLARATADDGNGVGSHARNALMRDVEVVEHYIRADIRGEGYARLWKVTTAGPGDTILRRGGVEDIEPVPGMPFAAITPVPVTHRFHGRSVADLVLEIQRIKTFLVRQLLDNAALVNNARTEVAESHAGERTLDDLLSSRPGGIVRTKAPGGLIPIVTPSVADKILPVTEYFDFAREQRTGVTRQGQGLDASALQNQSATAVNQAFTAAQARIRLIARIFAETGIKDLFLLLHGTIRRHGDVARTVRLRNRWVPVDPRHWRTRADMSVTVGIGYGSKETQAMHLMQVLGLQKEALAAGGMGMVDPSRIYNTLKKLIETIGLRTVEPYFNNPADAPPPGPPPPDPRVMEAQAKLQLEQAKAQAEAELQRMRLQADVDLARLKAEAEMQLAREKMAAEMALAREAALSEAQAKASTPPVRMGGEVG
ncbi:MAG TPA: ATP synthase F0 subunit B [Azospirillaceae bacterium]|nr:ATP synthase F0 subunit B [Azospirillaceae bacterium]